MYANPFPLDPSILAVPSHSIESKLMELSLMQDALKAELARRTKNECHWGFFDYSVNGYCHYATFSEAVEKAIEILGDPDAG